ncbi:CDGSH iron-sulfur domain-containing protein [Streptomyces sp. SS]|uniref:CDGSH iron-sulfur domain-containing protein n=1 Tax=Streptomyces sp. SS TaxID=260742 RepID=UPI00037C5A1F|nr:CDGSH iron-sulfur domain-containing protein [Streptomyces sp. SS]
MSASPDGNAPRAGTRETALPEARQESRGPASAPRPAGRRALPPRVQPLLEGPLLVEGPAEIVMPDGSVLHCERPVIALCTCRRTLRAPFCDTSHRPRLRRRARPEAGAAGSRPPRPEPPGPGAATEPAGEVDPS